MAPARPARRAFTLVEALAAIVVLAVLGSGASTIIMAAMNGYAAASLTAQLQTEGSTALDRLVREIQKIELDPSSLTPAPYITRAASDSLRWHGDCTLSLAGNRLMLSTDGAAAGVLLTDVAAFTMRVYDESNAPLAMPLNGAACAPIRRVQIELTLSRNGVSVDLRARAFIRSTMVGAEAAP